MTTYISLAFALTMYPVQVKNRKNVLQLGLPESRRRKVKLTERELKLAISRGAAMVQVKERICAFLGKKYLH